MSQSKTSPRLTISPAVESDLSDVIKLFTLYAESLNIDLGFQSFAEELAGLPGKYAPPTGQILLAKLHSQLAPESPMPESKPADEKKLLADGGRSEKEASSRDSGQISAAASSSELLPYDTVGCVAVRPISFAPPYNPGKEDVKTCEMKRLYAMPAARGQGLGKALIERILEAAESLGYEEMYLDTLSTMKTALSMYEKFGFERTQPYYHNPHAGVVFLVKKFGKGKADK